MNKAFEDFLYDFVHYGDCSDITGEFTKGDMLKAFQAGQRRGMERAAEIAEKTERECCAPNDPCVDFDNHECIWEACREPVLCAAKFIRKLMEEI